MWNQFYLKTNKNLSHFGFFYAIIFMRSMVVVLQSRKIRNLKIAFIVTFILLLLIPIMIMMIPRINIDVKGNKKVVLEVGSKYEDKGASAYLSNLFTKKNIKVKTTGEVDANKVGTYKITYEAKDNGQSKIVTREIQVVDKTKPTIKINKINACQNNKTFDIDAMMVI